MSSFLEFPKFIVSDYINNIIDKQSKLVPKNSLNGKVVGLYFSAHWCGPCRSFTPVLAEKYKSIVEAGHPFEIIFVSADQSAEEALSYFQNMPWLMIQYSERDVEEDLSKKLEVNGIPCLILFDENGLLLTKDGRSAIMNVEFLKLKTYAEEKKAADEKKARELVELKSNFNPSNYFASSILLKNNDGTSSISEDTLRKKMVGLYFSAHWCGPCRNFTPVLAEKYKSIVEAGHPFEIIFVSSDRSDETAKEYFATMPWLMLKYEDREKKSILSELFNVEGIPTLVLVDEHGLITTEGREAIMETPFEDLKAYEENKRLEIEKLNAEIAGFPESIKIDAHEHPLMKLPSVYRGSYGCDVCAAGGSGWVYHCDQCGFDVHPKCADKN